MKFIGLVGIGFLIGTGLNLNFGLGCLLSLCLVLAFDDTNLM